MRRIIIRNWEIFGFERKRWEIIEEFKNESEEILIINMFFQHKFMIIIPNQLNFQF